MDAKADTKLQFPRGFDFKADEVNTRSTGSCATASLRSSLFPIVKPHWVVHGLPVPQAEVSWCKRRWKILLYDSTPATGRFRSSRNSIASSHPCLRVIPFVENSLTACVDPIKYYEYRALGLPVLSSAFGEMTRRRGHNGVYLIDRNANMTELVSEALANCATAESTAHFRLNNSWERRFDQAGIFG